MKVYIFDEDTKEYLEERDALLDPEESKFQGEPIYLNPANSTREEPPNTSANEVAIWENESWVVRTDKRFKKTGKSYYNINTIERIIILDIGVDPDEDDNLTHKKPSDDGIEEGVAEWDDVQKKWKKNDAKDKLRQEEILIFDRIRELAVNSLIADTTFGPDGHLP